MNAPLRAPADAMHIWQWDLRMDASGLARCGEILSPDEWDEAARFHFERDRRRFIVRRAGRRQILAACSHCDPGEIRFITDDRGKPELAGRRVSGGIRFSCSHSNDLALVAVAHGREIGVDVEALRPRDSSLEAVAGRFSKTEREALDRTPADQWTKTFFDYWTCKEAYLKALGVGLSLPLHQFTVTLPQGAAPRLLAAGGDVSASRRWTLALLGLGEAWSAAVAAEGAGLTIHSHLWNPT